jgi:endonuclease/exonuclease/phosphatase family metal-dependent hydrolase
LFVLHLKSRLTNRDDDPRSAQRRLLEARALRDVILTRFPEPGAARFLVVGDFNDTKNSRPLAAMVRRGSTTITGILPTVDSRGEAWTHHHRPADEYTRVDFALASQGLQPFVVGGSGTIFDGAGAADASDHRLVYVDLEFNPQSPGRE